MFNKAMDIKKEICKEYGIRFADLEGPAQTRTVCCARFKAMGRIREETKLSFTEIGSIFGRRDHTTVIHAYKQYKKHPEWFQSTN